MSFQDEIIDFNHQKLYNITMYRGGSRIIPILLVIIVAVVAIIALVSVGKAILGRDTESDAAVDTTREALLSSELDRSVRMTVRGPIVADETFHSYQIAISPAERRMTTFRGYNDSVIDTKLLSGSTAAYEEFVHALDRAGFARTVKLPEQQRDMRGACADGRVYIFEILWAQSVVSESWTSSCRNLSGSFAGSTAEVRTLFQRQIPDSNTLLRGLNL